VLNLFSYTCSFSVAAAAGGAREVTSIDLSARALERGRQNFELNGIDPARHRFLRADAFDWLPRALRRRDCFDLVVLDPPSFGTRAKGKSFNVAQHYATLVEQAIGLLGARGRLLAITNHGATTLAELRRTLRQSAQGAGRQVAQLKDLAQPLDCPGPAPSKSVLLTLG
jgi:23S rRNA (cytosine1962-C5)-methyltransferase